MDYGKKYKEALEMAKKLRASFEGYNANVAIIEQLFPEFKESEDERIRKFICAIIDNLEPKDFVGVKKMNVLAWLEKQGGHKPSDKVEPKFKVWDWINGYYTSYKVLAVNNDGYVVEDVDGNIMNILFENERFHHLWTIQDAKDGDVLTCDSKKHGQEIGIVKKYVGKYGGCDKCFETYCFVDWDGNFRVGEHMGSQNIHPATKEQRDLLFSKMHEAGYEWDAEKKKLKKIEQKPITEIFGFKVGDTVRLKDGDGRKHTIKSFEKIEGVHGPGFYHVTFEDNSASDGIYPDEKYPNGYYTQMEKIKDEQKPEWNKKPCLTCQEYDKGYKQGYTEGCTAGYNKAVKEAEQKSAENLSKEEYVKKFKALCDNHEIKIPNRTHEIYHLCHDLPKLSIDSSEQKPTEWVQNDEKEPMEIMYAGKVYKVHGIREFPGGRNGYIIEDEPGHYDCILNPDEVLGGGYGINGCGSPYPTKDIAFSEQPAKWRDYFDDEVESVHKRYPEVSYAKLTRIAYHFAKWADNFKTAEWSKDDEDKLNHILEIVHISSGRESVDEKEELESFLKSIRPQSKQEWSDTYLKEARDNLIAVCRDWERGVRTTLLPIAAIRARYFLEHLTEPKPADWSEEDEDMLNCCISSIEEAKENRYAYKETDGDTSYDREINWLKSLHPVKQECSEKGSEKELDEFTENIRRLITEKLTTRANDSGISSTVFIDDATAKDIANGVLFYTAKEAWKNPDREIQGNVKKECMILKQNKL